MTIFKKLLYLFIEVACACPSGPCAGFFINYMDKVQLFIDGGNFYNLALSRLYCHDCDFDFENFSKFLIGERDLALMGKRFYIGSVREKQDFHETTKAMSGQNTLFRKLELTNWEIKTSKLRTRIESVKIDDRVENYTELLKKGINKVSFQRSREKGIDVKIATDLLIGAFDDRFDTAIVVSSDCDLIPAIDVVRKKFKKKVEYVGFSSPAMSEIGFGEEIRPVKNMIYNSDIQRIVPVSDLKQFILPEDNSEKI